MSDAANKGGSLTVRTFWLMSAKTLAFVFAFALPVLLTRRLSQSEYGLFKQVFLVVTTAVAVLPLGFGMSAYYYLPREQDAARRGQLVFNILLFSALAGGLACLALVLRPEILAAVFRDPALVRYAPLVGVVILLWLFSSFLEVIAVANQEMKLATLFIVGAQLTKTLLMLAAAILFDSVEALIYAALFQGALQTAALLWYLRSRFGGFWRRFDRQTLRAQAAYAMPFGLAGLLYALLMDLHNYFVSHRFDAATFAIYSIGVAQLPLVGILRESAGTVMIGRVSQLQKQNETREIVVLLARAMRKLAAVYLPLYAFLLVTGREFLTALFTSAYLESWPVFAINLTLLPLSILEFDAVIRAYAEHKYFMLKLRIVLFALLAVALWFGVLRFGLVGAIGVVVAVNFVERVATSIKFGRVIGVKAHDVLMLVDVGKLAASAALAALAALATRALILQGVGPAGARPFVILAACGVSFGAVYLSSVWLLGVPTDEERASLRRRISRLQQRAGWKRAAQTLS
jgi:O-antigen/teichoic acid export membrane protein